MRDWFSRERVRNVMAGALLFVVVAAPAAASWHGLVEFGTRTLDLHGGWEVVVPISLDAAAMYCAALAMRAVLRGDSASTPRLLTVAYAAASAGFNAVNALTAHEGIKGAAFFGGAALSAALLWDITLRAMRRDQLRELGAIESPLPRFRAVRWMVAPVETGKAWRQAVLLGITNPNEALDMVRKSGFAQEETHVKAVTRTEGESDGAVEASGEEDRQSDHLGDRRCGDLACTDHESGRRGGQRELGLGQGSAGLGRPVEVRQPADLVAEQLAAAVDAFDRGELKKNAVVAAAFDLYGERDIPRAIRDLEPLGFEVDRSYAYTVKWSPRKPELQVIGGEQ